MGRRRPALGIYLLTGFSITPNADVIGGHAGLNRAGLTRTLRFSREWRRRIDTSAGPYRVEFTRPMEEIRLVLEENPSGIEWDLRWQARAPAHLSRHHLAVNRGRRTTDQSRYNQVGRVEGWARIDGTRVSVDAADWLGSAITPGESTRAGRRSADTRRWLPPPDVPAARRALRFSFFFDVDEFSGYFHLHEDEEGRQLLMNDAFGTPFEGVIDWGWSRRLALHSATHALKFVPGTRSVSAGTLEVRDVEGGQLVVFLRSHRTAVRDRAGRLPPRQLEGRRQHPHLARTGRSVHGMGRVRFFDPARQPHAVRRERAAAASMVSSTTATSRSDRPRGAATGDEHAYGGVPQRTLQAVRSRGAAASGHGLVGRGIL